MKRQLQNEILDLLSKEYPDAHCELVHSNAFELLVATILSAQCTDVRVNQVTKGLFEKYNTPRDFVELREAELEKIIKSCGFFKTKAKNIIAASKIILEKHRGEVPRTMEELVALPGVGRKTASVILAVAFGIPAMPVDTHVFRLANRIGFVDADTVEKTEEQLKQLIEKERWIEAHHSIIFHGRRVCHARKPKCSECSIKDHCKYFLAG
jgi:endonuclease-3